MPGTGPEATTSVDETLHAIASHDAFVAVPPAAPVLEMTAASVTRSGVWIDRDVSWLEFNRRVLAQALDERVPLLERVKFLAIFSANLDEFFMKRIALLREGPPQEWARVSRSLREALQPMLAQQAECFLERLVPELSRHGVHIRRWEELSAAQQQALGEYSTRKSRRR
jgi:polyphosphate kinase